MHTYSKQGSDTEVEREIIRDRINNQACGGSTTIFEKYNQTFLMREDTSSIINYKVNEVKQTTKETGLGRQKYNTI
jgi:hypothetical protein